MAKPRKGSTVTLALVVNGPEVRHVSATVIKARAHEELDLEYQLGKNPPRIMERVPRRTEDSVGACWVPQEEELDDVAGAEAGEDPNEEPDGPEDPGS